MLSIQDAPGNRMSSISRESGGSHSEHSTVDSRSCSASRGITREAMWGNFSPEMRKEMRALELVAVEREYNELLQTTLKEKRLRVERLSDLLSENDNTSSNQQLQTVPPLLPPGFPLSPLVLQTKTSSKISPVCTVSTFQSLEQEPFSHVETSSNIRDDELAQWLRSFGCDNNTIGRIQAEEYTKQDLLDFVTREDLMRLNLRGGIVCRIWRKILQNRERQQFSGFSSTTDFHSRHDSSEDFHSMPNDQEIFSVTELNNI
ncbi:unnamed protein product [Onchocerca flexuosa]|uniref:SAM domain-containing protein n=1 Tax=Onchocerca flexuosa TaxID=387005 RepID=A0A183HHM1_9BILA|nr:unnamed protein product [Onchocerca flexuosa]